MLLYYLVLEVIQHQFDVLKSVVVSEHGGTIFCGPSEKPALKYTK